MATIPTNNPVPSESYQDLKFNAGKIDEFVTSLVNKYIDRYGGEHYTVEGLTNLLKKIVSNLGLVPFGTFESGATLDNGTQALKSEDGNYYRWDGDFPKIVPASSTPESTGGVERGAWVNVTDLTLRADLGSSQNGLGAYLSAWKGASVGDLLEQQYRYYDDVFDVFILYGQSNIVGYADNTQGYPTTVDDYVSFYNPATGQIAKVFPAMPHASGNISTGHAWAAFGNEYRKQTGRKILFVPCGQGQTDLADFVPGTTLYNLMLTTVAAAKTRMNDTGRAIGKTCVLFHQGEQDMTSGTTRQTYQDHLVSLVTGTRGDLAIDKFFILRVGCPQSRTEESWYAVQAVQDFLCQSFNICNMPFADFGKFTQGNGLLRPDGTHATQYGYNYMGQQAAKNVAEALMVMSPSSPAEMQMYGVPVLPQDQIWRYTYARAVKTSNGWIMQDMNSAYRYRTANILSMTVNDTYIRFIIQSRANWILDLDVDVNYLAKTFGVRAAVSFSVVSGDVCALDVAFFADLSFGCSKTADISSPPWFSAPNSLFSENVTAVVDAQHNSVVITHNGSQSMPTVTSYAGIAYENETGIVAVAALTTTSFAVVNAGSGGSLVTIPNAIIKPASLLEGMHINVKSLVCEKKI